MSKVGLLSTNFTDEGIRLEDVKVVSRNARRQSASNPILKRGAMLRSSYVFGHGFKMSSRNNPLPPRFQAIVDDPINQQVLFGEAACKRMKERYLLMVTFLYVTTSGIAALVVYHLTK